MSHHFWSFHLQLVRARTTFVLIPWRETSLSGFRSEQFVCLSVTQGPRHNFLRCLRARDFFQLTLFKVFTSSPTFFQAIFPRPGFEASRERAGCPRCNPATFRDPASAGSVPGGAPAMAGFTALRGSVRTGVPGAQPSRKRARRTL